MKIKKLFENRILAGFGILFIFSVIMGLVLAGDVIINAPAGEINATTINAPTGRTATYVVCAKDSVNKAQCDYVCDGVDDDVQFQAALDACSSGGCEVVGLDGHYNFTTEVLVGNDTTLRFLSGSHIFVPENHTMTVYYKYSDPFSAIIMNKGQEGKNIKIIGANIDFNGDNGKSTAQGWAGIWLDNCENCSIRDCAVHDVVYSVDWSKGRAYGILVSDGKYVYITDCIATHNGYEGIGIRGNSSYIYVTRCRGADNRQHAFQASSWAPTLVGRPDHIYFMDCIGEGDLCIHANKNLGASHFFVDNFRGPAVRFIGDLEYAAVTNSQVKFIGMGDAGVSGVKVSRILIENNLIVEPTHSGNAIYFNFWGSNSTVETVRISGNIVYAYRFIFACAKKGGSTVRNIDIVDNTFLGTSGMHGTFIKNNNDSMLMTNISVYNNRLHSIEWFLVGNMSDVYIVGNIIDAVRTETQNKKNIILKDNYGFLSQNSGNLSLANGDSVNHGLTCIPAVPSFISVTSSNPDHIASVTAKNSTTFTLGLKDYNGTAITTPEEIYWYAEC